MGRHVRQRQNMKSKENVLLDTSGKHFSQVFRVCLLLSGFEMRFAAVPCAHHSCDEQDPALNI